MTLGDLQFVHPTSSPSLTVPPWPTPLADAHFLGYRSETGAEGSRLGKLCTDMTNIRAYLIISYFLRLSQNVGVQDPVTGAESLVLKGLQWKYQVKKLPACSIERVLGAASRFWWFGWGRRRTEECMPTRCSEYLAERINFRESRRVWVNEETEACVSSVTHVLRCEDFWILSDSLQSTLNISRLWHHGFLLIRSFYVTVYKL